MQALCQRHRKEGLESAHDAEGKGASERNSTAAWLTYWAPFVQLQAFAAFLAAAKLHLLGCYLQSLSCRILLSDTLANPSNETAFCPQIDLRAVLAFHRFLFLASKQEKVVFTSLEFVSKARHFKSQSKNIQYFTQILQQWRPLDCSNKLHSATSCLYCYLEHLHRQLRTNFTHQ